MEAAELYGDRVAVAVPNSPFPKIAPIIRPPTQILVDTAIVIEPVPEVSNLGT